MSELVRRAAAPQQPQKQSGLDFPTSSACRDIIGHWQQLSVGQWDTMKKGQSRPENDHKHHRVMENSQPSRQQRYLTLVCMLHPDALVADAEEHT
jgi:hypothetical protein